MAYKDKDKQREADRDRQRRYRETHPVRGKRRDEGVTNSGCDTKGVTITKADSHINASGINVVKALHQITTKPERTAQGNIRVSKPGDADYVPQCETTRAFENDGCLSKDVCPSQRQMKEIIEGAGL